MSHRNKLEKITKSWITPPDFDHPGLAHLLAWLKGAILDMGDLGYSGYWSVYETPSLIRFQLHFDDADKLVYVVYLQCCGYRNEWIWKPIW
jgi:hypothetical protein